MRRRTAFALSRPRIGARPFCRWGLLESGKRVTTAEKVRFLASLEAYPGSTGPVSVEETHMSWVFLVDERVYKLKKPVRYPFLDFTTLEARKANCREEVRLNRRLAPEVYLGVVALNIGANGRLAIGGDGEVVDWLVKMRRLPAERMLDRAIAEGTVDGMHPRCGRPPALRFYGRAAAEEMSGAEYARQFAMSRPSPGHPDQPRLRSRPAARGFGPGSIEKQLDGSGIVGSAPNRAESSRDTAICARSTSVLVDPPAIIDCLEFSRQLRLVDPVDELVFLWLECERLGAGWVGSASLIPVPSA
jgi:uncharacterized protein